MCSMTGLESGLRERELRQQYNDRIADATHYLRSASEEVAKAIALSANTREDDQLHGVKAIILGSMDVLSGLETT